MEFWKCLIVNMCQKLLYALGQTQKISCFHGTYITKRETNNCFFKCMIFRWDVQ
jgi:hypothetical protein